MNKSFLVLFFKKERLRVAGEGRENSAATAQMAETLLASGDRLTQDPVTFRRLMCKAKWLCTLGLDGKLDAQIILRVGC